MVRPQFRQIGLSMSMCRAVIINYFLVQKMEEENVMLLSTQVLLRSNKVSLA